MISEQQRKLNRLAAMEFFVASGFTDIQAAGIVGNLMQESGMDPDIHEIGGGAGYGLAQWTAKSRKLGLESFAISQDKPTSDFELQLRFIVHELQQPDFRKARTTLGTADSIVQATNLVSMYYEMPGTPYLNNRIKYACQALDEYQQHLEGGETI